MAFAYYSPPGGAPNSIEYIGAIEMRDMFIPKPGKDEWGLDTLERQVRGPACVYDVYNNALVQGAQYTVNGKIYYLQSWRPVTDKIFPGFSLLCKGLPFNIPDPYVTGQQVELSGSLSVSTPQKASRNLRYLSWKSTFRYITNSKPTGPANTVIDRSIAPQVTFSEITDESGKLFYGNAPAGLVTALTPVGYKDIAVLDFSVPVIGTPYFENQDTVTRYFPIQ